MSDENQNPEEPVDPRPFDRLRAGRRLCRAVAAGSTPRPVRFAVPFPRGGRVVGCRGARPPRQVRRMLRHPSPAEYDDDVLTVDDILNAAQAEVREPSDEHLADLKRVTAEYANYRKRTEANREVERERAVGAVVAVLLPGARRPRPGREARRPRGRRTRSRRSRRSFARPSRGSGSRPSARSASHSTRSGTRRSSSSPRDEVEIDTVAEVVENGLHARRHAAARRQSRGEDPGVLPISRVEEREARLETRPLGLQTRLDSALLDPQHTRFSREEVPMASQDWFDKDFYQVLGVSKDVSDAELKKVLPQARAQVPPRLESR